MRSHLAGGALPPPSGVRRFRYANLHQASHVAGLRCQNVPAKFPLNHEQEVVRVFINFPSVPHRRHEDNLGGKVPNELDVVLRTYFHSQGQCGSLEWQCELQLPGKRWKRILAAPGGKRIGTGPT